MSKFHENPLWRALDQTRRLVTEREDEFDLVGIYNKCEPTKDSSVCPSGFVEMTVRDWENLLPSDFQAELKARYLLGLAVGLHYAKISDAEIKKIIDAYGRTAR